MTNCSYCGRENDDDQTACRGCGTDLQDDSESFALSLPSRRSILIVLALCLCGGIVVVWIDFVASRSSRLFETIEVRGTANFRERVVNALILLKAKSPSSFEMVTNYIRVIAQAKHTGMAAYETPPTSYVSPNVFTQSTTLIAASFAHESLHSKLYHNFLRKNLKSSVPDEVWSGATVEKECCDLMVRVLEEIGAPAAEIFMAGNIWSPTNRYWEIPFDQRP